MASGTVKKGLKLYYKDYVSASVTVASKDQAALSLGSIAKSGYSIVNWRYAGGSTSDMRNRVIPYGFPGSEGTGMKVYNVGSASYTGTITIRIFYLPTGELEALS